jgi:nucleotide-binding universal stress UspA family protein
VSTTRIVVGLDGSAAADAAVAWALEQARALRAEVVVVHAVGLLEHLREGEAREQQLAVTRAEEVWSSRLHDAGVPHHAIRRDGNPVTVLLDVAREVDADLVVVGSRGADAHPHGLLGSTSTQISQRSDRPVVIVPGPHPAA